MYVYILFIILFIVKVGRYIDLLKIANITGASFLSLCQAVFWILFLGHLFACLWFGTVNLNDTVLLLYMILIIILLIENGLDYLL